MKVLLVAVCCVLAVTLAQGPPPPPPPPPFLEGASKEILDAWNALTAKFAGETESQVSDEVEKFVGAHPELKGKYEEFKKKVIEEQKAAEETHKSKVAALSSGAKDADKKLAEIADDKALTHEQKHKKIVETFSTLPKGVQDELQKAGQ